MSERLPGTRPRVSLVRPRLDAKPWGGTRLREFGLPASDGETIGEALVTANDAVITDGFGADSTLGEIVASAPDDLMGRSALAATGHRPLFPLLVKLIDAREALSIQVHPDDAEAAPLDSLGKTEAWHVLRAEPDARLYLGLKDPEALHAFVAAADRLDGSSAEHLRDMPAVPGETWLLPAGTVHALGAGVVVYEIQQPSAITYRLDDWGRLDANGSPREMHREQGLAVLKPRFQPTALERVPLPATGATRARLVSCRYFALERWDITRPGTVDLPASEGPQVVTVLEGAVTIEDLQVGAGESAVIWPGGTTALTSASSVFLRGIVPDEPEGMEA